MTTPAKRPQTITDVRSSEDFLAYIEDKRTASQRKADDHQAEVDSIVGQKARLETDYKTAIARHDARIAVLRELIADERDVTWRCETMLGLERPAAAVEITATKGDSK